METQAHLETKSLILTFDGGMSQGKKITKSKTFSTINDLATDDKLYSTANILAGLQEKTLLKVNKRETSSIREI